MNIGLLRAVFPFFFYILSICSLLGVAGIAQAQTISVTATGATTFTIQINNVYSWKIEELVGGSWTILVSK